MIARLARFIGVGGLATLVHVTSAFFVREALGLSELMANGLGWLAAVAISYFGHLRVTFGVLPNHATQLPRFFLISAGGLMVSSATVATVKAAGGNFTLAMAFVAVLVPVASYLLLQFWVFSDSKAATFGVSLETIVAGMAALAIIAVFWGQPIHHDVIWYHVATRKWLAGAELYTEIVEVNPPLAFYLTLPVVMLADLTGLSDKVAQLIFTALLTFASLSLTGRALAATGLFTSRQRAISLAGVGAVLIILTLRDFAQREHIFVLLFLPWLASTIVPERERSPGLTLLAAIGMCIKPFFVIFPLSILILTAIRGRSLAPLFSLSALIFLITGLTYIGAVALWHPAYLTEIMPMANLVYGAYGAPFLFVALVVLTPITALCFAAAIALLRSSPPEGTVTFFTAALAGIISYFIQGTGFGYHALPFLAFGTIACIFALFDRRCRVIALIGLGVIAYESVDRGYYHNAATSRIVPLLAEQTNVDSLLVVTTFVHAGPIVAVDAGVDWANEYPTQWLVAGALDARARTNCSNDPQRCKDIDAILDRNREDLRRDILAGRPDMVIFDQKNGYFDAPFKWEDFLAHGQPFADLMLRYRLIGYDERFSYWKRTDLD